MKPLSALVLPLLAVPLLAAAAPLPGANEDMDMVCLGPGGVTALFPARDATREANDAVPLDVPLADDGNQGGRVVVYLGLSEPFRGLVFDLGLPGMGAPVPLSPVAGPTQGSVSWFYSRGSSWRSLDVQDGTENFHQAGLRATTFDPPSDWAPTQVFGDEVCPGEFFFVKVLTDDNYLTRPIANQISAILEESP